MMLYNIVSEKDLKLRQVCGLGKDDQVVTICLMVFPHSVHFAQGLKLIGLKDSVYWFSWYAVVINMLPW